MIAARVSLAGCLLTLGLTACEDKPPPPASSSTGPQSAAPEAASTPAPAEPPPATASTPAEPVATPGFEHGERLFWVIGPQLHRLDTHGPATLSTASHGELRDAQRPSPPAPILDMFETLDAALYVRDQAALYQLDGDALVEHLRFSPELLPVHDLALDRDGQPWIVSDAGVGPRTEDGWALTPLAELELDSSAELGFDHENTAWLAMPGHALYRDAQRWVPTEVALLGPDTNFHNAMGSPVGRVHVSNHHLMTRLGKTNYDSIVVDFKRTLDYSADLDIAPDGYACVATRACAIACANAVPPTIIWRFDPSHYACTELEAIAVDAQHRVWVVSATHLSLLDPAERTRPAREWPRTELPTMQGSVRELVVIDPIP